jgi:hypothetical protein
MIGFQLLILAAEGQLRAKELAGQVNGRATSDPSYDWQECVAKGEAGVTDPEKIGKLEAECCVPSVTAWECQLLAAACKALHDEKKEWEEGEVEGFCKQWCKDRSEDWCPSGLSTGAIVGIVLGSIAGAALIVWLILRCCCRGGRSGSFSLF